MLPVVLAAMTVVAITLSPHAAYSQMAQFGRIAHTPSAEVLKLHASNAVMMTSSLEHPDLPPFVIDARQHRG